jgi:hypothetical protein
MVWDRKSGRKVTMFGMVYLRGRLMTTGVFITLMTAVLTHANVTPLAQAHAHNDYLHGRPLFDALSHGFTSVEADVFLVGEKLCVAHEARAIKPERTLQSLYLDPLRERMKENNGRIYPACARFLLLIDIKSAAEPTYLRPWHSTATS